MKNIIVILAFVFTAFSISAQSQEVQDLRKKRVNIKISPTMPLIESFGGGIEVFIFDNASLEIEGAISNLIPESTDFHGSTSYDYNKYKRLSSRMKLHIRKSSYDIKERGFFNSLYIAPGVIYGEEKYIFYKDDISKYASGTFDFGLTITRYKTLTFESFIGAGLRTHFTNDNGIQLSPRGRMGFRLGIIL
jgi:hypothetical protein